MNETLLTQNTQWCQNGAYKRKKEGNKKQLQQGKTLTKKH